MDSKVKCPCCNEPLNGTAIEYPGRQESLILSCSCCGSGRASPSVELDYSGQEYWSRPSSMIYPVPYGLAKIRASLIHQYVPRPSHTLDIGAGHGYLGWFLDTDHYHIVEPSRVMSDYIKHSYTKPNLCIRDSLSLIDTTDDRRKYDLIVLSSVLEHLTEPASMLIDALQLTHSGSFVFIEVPNLDYQFKEDVFPHTTFFSKTGLCELMRRCKLELVYCDTFGNRNPSTLLRKLVGSSNRVLPSSLVAELFMYVYGFRKVVDTNSWCIRAVGRVS